ncbi:nuclear transport factor 2 family protein [Chitinophaga sp. CB10]|uniref:nuclear transport factor 2 family protein n=1 Tax=Chitinophaga sp. CB10 TaxID=1891659 RepID=UPI0025B9D2F0|nr:nuclear transport factor 2 family protein [Chitinophaga sp. CB10]
MKEKILETIENWHNALNAKDKNHLAGLVKEDVKMVGPKGDVKGKNIMLDWVDRANITLTPKRYFLLDNTVIVEETAVWHEAETGKESNTAIVAPVFVLENGLITSIHRHDSLHKAFESTGLNEKNLITK